MLGPVCCFRTPLSVSSPNKPLSPSPSAGHFFGLVESSPTLGLVSAGGASGEEGHRPSLLEMVTLPLLFLQRAAPAAPTSSCLRHLWHSWNRTKHPSFVFTYSVWRISFFTSTLMRYNLHTIEFPYCKSAVWWVLTNCIHLHNHYHNQDTEYLHYPKKSPWALQIS